MIVYRHRKITDLEVFYVGISGDKTRHNNKVSRSSFWKNIESKHGRSVEIIASGLTRDDACELEEFLIQEYGRRDLGTGLLVNLTTGGDFFKHSELSKKKMSIIALKSFKGHAKGRVASKEERLHLSKVKTGSKMPRSAVEKTRLANTGRKHSKETRDKVSLSKTGGKHPRSKRVIDSETKKVFECIKDAAINIGINPSTLRSMLGGQNKNKTSLQYMEQ